MKIEKILLVVLMAVAFSASAQERGRAIHADDFDVTGTFAEYWKVKQGATVVPANGKIEFTGRGLMTMNRETPGDFYAEMEVVPRDAVIPRGFCGFSVETTSFGVTPDGKWFLRYLPLGQDQEEMKSGEITGFTKDKSVRIGLVRVCGENEARCRFLLDGKEVASARLAPPTALTATSFAPLAIECRAGGMTIDNFSLHGVKRAGESSNLIVNSGFEHDEDGFPTYICRLGAFRSEFYDSVPYDDFIGLWSLDTEVKHSGKQSLKIVKNRRISKGDQLWTWGHGTEKGKPAVFSVWLKSDFDGLEVRLGYGGGPGCSKVVKAGTEWGRHELAVTNSPGRGTYPAITVTLVGTAGEGASLWIDDMQAEIIQEAVTADDIRSGKLFATEYRPAEVDKVKFATERIGRSPAFAVPRLPAGLVPSADLDSWKEKAVRLDDFYVGQKPAAQRTEVYVACDEKNLYVGYRNHGETFLDPAVVKDIPLFGAQARSVEAFFDPAFDGRFFQFARSSKEAKAIGAGRDTMWKSSWSSQCVENKTAGSVDYFLVYPFGDFASPKLRGDWPVNFGRNDAKATECSCTTKSFSGGFQEVSRWRISSLPEEIVSRYRIGVEKVTRAGSPGSEVYTVHVANKSGADRTVTAICFNATEGDSKVAEKRLTVKAGATASFECRSEKPMRMASVKLVEGGETIANGKVPVVVGAPVKLTSRLNYYMREPEAVYRVDCALAEPEKLRAILECVGKRVEAAGAASFKVALPLSGIADGEHKVTLRMIRPDGSEAGAAAATLVKRPYSAFAAQVNHFTRSLMHGGKGTFMFAPFIGDFHFNHIFTSNSIPHDVALFKKYGFNAVHFLVPMNQLEKYRKTRPVDTAVACLKAAEERGMVVDMWIGRYGDCTEEEFSALKERLASRSVLAVQVLDEPEISSCTSDQARDILRRMRGEFPYYPVVMNNTVLGIPNRFGNLETDVLMLDDYLTNADGREVASIVRQTDIMREAGREEGKPCYYFVVGSNFPLHYKEPSYREQVAQCYGNVAAGCSGLSFFCAYPVTPGNWKAYKQLAKEFGVLGDVIVSEEECEEASCDADAKVLRFITRRHDGHLYIIACNIGEETAGKVTFTLPSAYRYDGAKVVVLFDGRDVELAAGRFSDEIGPLERRVYRIALRP